MGDAKARVNKWHAGYAVIALIGALLAIFVQVQSAKDYAAAVEHYRKNAHAESQLAAKTVSNALSYIYQGIRTISLLPSVKNIDRYGKNLDDNARESILQIYDNMASNVDVSEVYIVSVDLDPEKTDKITGKKEEPILMFDGKLAAKKTDVSENPEEEEIYEYRLLHEQMGYLKQHYARATTIDYLKPPFLSGPEVITCDNTEYNQTKNDADRTGMVFSVPFYDSKGVLKGTISAIILNHNLRNILPEANYALINQTYRYALLSKNQDQGISSLDWIHKNQADPSLLFSTVIPITTNDTRGEWSLWVGYPDEKFLAGSDAKAVQDFRFYGFTFSFILTLFSLAVWAIQQRNFNIMSFTVSSRTGALEHTLSQIDLLKTVATAANEAESINDGLQIAIDAICKYTGWPVGHAYFYAEEKKALTSLKVWHLRDPSRCQVFKRITEATDCIPGEGFIGEIYKDSTPMWVLDVADSNVYRRKQAASEAGLKAAFGFPIFVGKSAVAVVEFYSSEALIPDESFLSSMANIGKQLGQVIERVQFKEKAQLLETIITGANDGIIITKATLNDPGPEIIYVNEAFNRMSGYSNEEVIGKSPRILQGEFTKRETLDDMRLALEEGKPYKSELLNYHKNGTPYWLDISIVPVRNGQGEVTHYAAIERDITQRKKEETEYKNMWVQLKRANLKMEATAKDLEASLRKAEEANKAKSDFLANMSHELRTPMNGVLGMAQLLTDTPLDSEQKEFVSTINSSGENLLVLLNDILDFSKIEAGALELENIPYALVELLESTVNLLKPNASKKYIDLIADCDNNVPPYVMGDGGRVRQIITNLIGNSLKFTEAGYVHLSAKMVEKGGESFLNIRVEDTGIGIAIDKLPTIFDKFTQADGTITRKYGGTGLGLAISKQLVTLMGGEMGVESVEGKGSTFWFTIPCNPADHCDIGKKMDTLQEKPLSAMRRPISEAVALLVEDYPVNRIFAEKLLKKFGFTQIDFAENGAEAITKYRSRIYDVIFMDCQMPEMDGYQATQKIRLLEADTPLHTPIVAMTANAMMGDREKCLKAGMDDYISKPLRVHHLKSILQTIFMLNEETTPATAGKKSEVHKSEEEAPVDMEQLRMFTDGNKEEELALATLFIGQARETIAILERSTEADKKAEWKSASHRFKGASGNLGAMKLHHLCKRAEVHFEDNQAQKQDMLAAMHTEMKRIESFFAGAK